MSVKGVDVKKSAQQAERRERIVPGLLWLFGSQSVWSGASGSDLVQLYNIGAYIHDDERKISGDKIKRDRFIWFSILPKSTGYFRGKIHYNILIL